jgi:anhydro-N-acetylmuramic acid kinase
MVERKSEKYRYRVIGIMSGTSLDGVDIACCIFTKKDSHWRFQIEKALTVPYTKAWRTKLSTAHTLPAESLLKLHAEYGLYLGNLCKKFKLLYGLKKVDFIASHGHTVFHQPKNKFTFQLGDGNALHMASALPVIYDFRSLDVAAGGQGAPLVPIGDQLLFPQYDVCLNLGGIANLSRQVKGKRIAYDICFANMGLNYLAGKAGKEYDHNGAIASDGELNQPMMKALSKGYDRIHAKRPSLGREYFEKHVKPLLDQESIPLANRLHTFTESIATEIATVLKEERTVSVLCTGGGALNSYLVYRVLHHCGDSVDLVLPDAEIISFKEAIVFAFLGVKRLRGEINCLKSVTHASHDTIGGVLVGF